MLDYGCGWGANTIVLGQLRPSLKVWSFDLSPERALATRFNLGRLGLGCERLFVADGSRLPLPDGAVRRLGYPRGIAERARRLGWTLVEHRLANPAWGRTPGELILLRK